MVFAVIVSCYILLGELSQSCPENALCCKSSPQPNQFVLFEILDTGITQILVSANTSYSIGSMPLFRAIARSISKAPSVLGAFS